MKEISAALVKAQKAFNKALKNSENPHFRSKFADLQSCFDAVKDAMNDNGIFICQKPLECDGGVKIETVFIHESGESMEMGVTFVPVTKKDAQGYGSALTYCRRYSVMTACGIAPEDDDGNAAVKVSNATVDQNVVKSIESAETMSELKEVWLNECNSLDIYSKLVADRNREISDNEGGKK